MTGRNAVESIWGQRSLIRELVKREIDARYRGTFFGIGWYVLNNLALLAIYTTVFGVIFEVRWPNSAATTSDFALRLFTGLIIFNIASEVLARSPTLIVVNPNYVKKIVFPLEVLSVVSIGATLYNTLIAFVVLALAVLVLGHPFHWTVVLAPLLLITLLPWLVGLSWFLAALGVYVRDVGQIVPLLTTALLFLSPVFFPRQSIPKSLDTVVMLNPIAAPIEAARDLVLNGVVPPLEPLLVQTAVGLLVAFLGFTWFNLTKRGFADVL